MICCIYVFFEWVDIDMVEGVDEGFFFGLVFYVDLDDFVDYVGYLFLGEGWVEDLFEVGVVC